MKKLRAVAGKFGVTMENLLSDEENAAPTDSAQSIEEAKVLLNAFKSAPENVQEAIRKLLGLP